ncbi:MAG: PilZ domain-containing protein [Candidatus Omnitrophica bacterium]|nr:PilZ domain-containing protein [Candidatus Omnitrophota bacterium]MBU4457365.1 PilZ domain-containing protein [Candidatus Omnitrophota bacterium]
MSIFSNDHREIKRYDLSLKLNYYDPLTNSKGEALTKNICKNGLRFPVHSKIPKGALLDLNIEDPFSEKLIRSKAKVVWAEEYVTGDDAEDAGYEVGVKLLKKLLY